MLRALDRNAGSKPIRNGALNPSFETQGALANIRQNLATDPAATNLSSAWAVIGTGMYSRAVDNTVSHNGTTSIKNTLTTAARPGVKTMIQGGVSSGETVSWSLWVYAATAITGNAYWERSTPTYAGAPVSGVFTVPALTWTKITASYTFNSAQADPAGTFGFGFYGIETCAIGFTLNADEAIVEKSPVPGTYFDGATPAAGDFTYAWNGTVNASTSFMRGIVVSNTTGVNVDPVSSTAWFTRGTRSCRMVPNSTGVSTDSFVAPGGDTGGMRLGMEAGKTYTAAATFRQDQVLTGTLRTATPTGVTAFWKKSDGNYTNKSSAFKANAIGVERLAVTFTIPAGATEAFVRLYHGGQRGAGDVWVSDFICVEGEYAGDYVDGAAPFAKWDGAANASTSVGYPPQLLDIAGAPALDLSSGNSGGVAIPVDPFAARTVYLCYDSYGLTQNYPNYGYYGVMSSRGITLQTASSGSTALFPRLDFPGGSSNIGITHSGGRLLRRHVVAFAFPQGLASTTSCLNGGADRTDALNPGSGWDDGRAGLSTFGEGKGVRIVVFYAEHDRATRLAISRYLGNKYGAYVA